MLLPFRWLLYGTGAVATPKTGEAHKDEKLLRRIRRITRWSEAVAPPRIAVTIKGAAIPPLQPAVASGTLTITRHVAVYNKGPVIATTSLAEFIGVDVAVGSANDELRSAKSEIKSGEIVAAIDLFQEEYLMLLAA